MTITSLVVSLIVVAARQAHLLDKPETWWLDKMANADEPSFDSPIVVVGINDRDYYDPALFDGTSPLAPDVLGRIVSGVLAHRPRGLVLDILIHPSPGESPERVSAREQLYGLLIDASKDVPIVLVRDRASEAPERRTGEPAWLAFDELIHCPSLTWASAAVKRSGGFVRAVPRRYEDDRGSAGGLPTVLGAAVTAFGLKGERPMPWWIERSDKDPTAPWRVRFSRCFVEAGSSMGPHQAEVAALVSKPAVPGARSLLTDKIVLVGGTFHASRDILPTVVGDMAGVHFWAEAIGSWIRSDALREPIPVVAFLLEFLTGALLALLLVRLENFFGLLVSLAIVGPLTVVFSVLTFGDRVLFINFLPSVLAVYLHSQLDLYLENRSLKNQVAQLSQGAPRPVTHRGRSARRLT